MVKPGVHHVPVAGGDLAVEVLPGTTEPVLAVHGISSHRRLWLWLRAERPDLTLVAPDLRGRADSIGVTGPSSVRQHAADLVAVLDALDLERAHVVGMSMGGFVAVELAARNPERVTSLVLVDGGFPMAQPPGLTREAVPAVFADRLGRLEQAWDLEGLLGFFTSTTAPLLDAGDPLLRQYLAHDLGTDGRVRLSGDALVQDAESVFFDETPWRAVGAPVRFLHAEWASGAGTPPAYPDVTAYAERCVDVRLVPGVDHAGIIMSPTGAAATAEVLDKALAS